jgi:integrase
LLTKRDHRYHLDLTSGGTRYRCSLGTSNRPAAVRLANRVAFALADGPRSVVWGELKSALPKSSYSLLTAKTPVPPSAELADFKQRFEARLDRREKLGEIVAATNDLYRNAAASFFTWLTDKKVATVEGITPALVDEYLISKKQTLGRGLATVYTSLQTVFKFAVEEGTLQVSPLKGKYNSTAESSGAEPFTPEEMDKLAGAATESDKLAFLLLRHTGMRCSDVASVTWSSINWTEKTLTWRTQKRKVVVTIPLVRELMGELELSYASRVGTKAADGPVLGDISRIKLYNLVKELGKRAGVEKAHPHRFRDSRAVSILAKGGTIYDVARILGIKVATADTYYTRFTEQLQERVRGILEGN